MDKKKIWIGIIIVSGMQLLIAASRIPAIFQVDRHPLQRATALIASGLLIFLSIGLLRRHNPSRVLSIFLITAVLALATLGIILSVATGKFVVNQWWNGLRLAAWYIMELWAVIFLRSSPVVEIFKNEQGSRAI